MQLQCLRKKAYPRAPKVPAKTVAALFLAAKRAYAYHRMTVNKSFLKRRFNIWSSTPYRDEESFISKFREKDKQEGLQRGREREKKFKGLVLKEDIHSFWFNAKKEDSLTEAKPELMSPRSPREVTNDCGISETAKAGSFPSNATEPDTAKSLRTLCVGWATDGSPNKSRFLSFSSDSDF